jgi:hypothetical protein
MPIIQATRKEVATVLARLRPADAQEARARTGELPDPAELLPAFAAMDQGHPVAIGGVRRLGPHHGTAWFLASDGLASAGGRLAVAIHRAALELHRSLALDGVRRWTVLAWADHPDAGRWLRRLGYSVEGSHPRWGINGECFYTWGRQWA